VGARQHAVADLDGRTVRVSRPSMRGSPARIWLRTMLGFDLEQQAFDLDLVELDASAFSAAITLA
jgi:hypothetical protein